MINSQQVKKLEEDEMNIGKPLRTIYIPEPDREQPIRVPEWPWRKSKPQGIPVPEWPERKKVETGKEAA